MTTRLTLKIFFILLVLYLPCEAAEQVVGWPHNTPVLVTGSDGGSTTSGNCAEFDANGNITDSGAACAGSGTDDQTIDVFSLSTETLSLSLEDDGEATKTVDLSGTGHISNIVEDTTPQLGGDLDAQDTYDIQNLPEIIFTGQSSPSHSPGLFTYSTDDEALEFHNDESDVKLQIGQEFWVRVRNESGSTISDGKAVYVSGNHPGTGLPTIELARSDALSTSTDYIGLATHDIENNTVGYVTAEGRVGGLNTSGFSNGDTLFLDASTAGDLTATRPAIPNYTVPVGTVTKANASNGTIHVFPRSLRFGAFTDTRVAFGSSDGFIIEDAGFTYTSATDILNLGGGIDGIGAVDMDYGSADITDHTFTTDNGTAVILDGTASAIGVNEIVDKGDTASLTAAGIAEQATTAEMDTGTDTTRFLGVNEFNHSDWGARTVFIVILDDTVDTAVADGEGDFEWVVPTVLDGYNIVDVECGVYVAGTTNGTDVQIHNVTSAADILTTICEIESAETSSFTATTPPVISATEDDLTAADRIRFDVDAISTGTAAKGLWLQLTVRKP
jgi:hypothetical protein